MDEALTIKQQHLPKYVYKYRRDCECSRSNLKTDTVWFCSPDSYNDPYDCAFKLSDDRVRVVLESRLVPTFVTVYGLQGVVSAAQIEDAKNSRAPLEAIVNHIPAGFKSTAPGSNPKRMAEYCSKVVPGLVSDMLSILRQWRKMTKVCSFSTIADSVLMWSHYAENHQGFCLEYDLESLGRDHPFCKYLYPVVYSDQLYDLTPWAEKLAGPDRQAFNPECPLLGVLHKFDGWEYENEWRLVEVSKAVIDDHNWPVPTPTRILLGSRMKLADHEELLAICKQKNVEVHQMDLAKDKFELVPRPLCL